MRKKTLRELCSVPIMEAKRVKVNTVTNKCELCKKRYKFPGSVCEPRDRICFTCEVAIRQANVLTRMSVI